MYVRMYICINMLSKYCTLILDIDFLLIISVPMFIPYVFYTCKAAIFSLVLVSILTKIN